MGRSKAIAGHHIWYMGLPPGLQLVIPRKDMLAPCFVHVLQQKNDSLYSIAIDLVTLLVVYCGVFSILSFRQNKVKTVYIVLLPGHFCQAVMWTFLLTAFAQNIMQNQFSIQFKNKTDEPGPTLDQKQIFNFAWPNSLIVLKFIVINIYCS